MSPFKPCCNDLHEELHKENSTISMRDNTVFTIVEYDTSVGQKGLIEEALTYCPFCGTQLREEEMLIQYSMVG